MAKKDLVSEEILEELIKNEDIYENTYSKKDLCDNDRIIVTKI